jgi:hypothetical protein
MYQSFIFFTYLSLQLLHTPPSGTPGHTTHILLVHNVVMPRLLHLVEVYYVEMVGEDIVEVVL